MGTYNAYTPEQESFLRNHAIGISRDELTKKFNQKFHTNKKRLAITSWCNNRGLFNEINCKYENGNISWQTGLSGEAYKNHFTKDTFHKSIANIIDKRIYDIGDEFMKGDDICVVTSIDKNVPSYKRITFKRRYVYEKAYGKIPSNHRIIQLDNNKLNFELDNLYCMPNKFILIINKNNWRTDSREHTLTAIKWCELHFAMKHTNKEWSQ